jgi:hypothetical protein
MDFIAPLMTCDSPGVLFSQSSHDRERERRFEKFPVDKSGIIPEFSVSGLSISIHNFRSWGCFSRKAT